MEAVIRPFAVADTQAVVRLWTVCGLTRPWNDPNKDIERKLAVQPELFLVMELDGAIMGSAMAGYDGHRGSVYYVAIDPAFQGQGHGTRLMKAVETMLIAMGCPKLSILVRRENTSVREFYAKADYAEDDVISLGKRLIPDA